MATINFPANPQLNDTYTFLGRTWIYNGIGWVVKPDDITAFVNKGGDTMSGKLTITSGGLSVSGTTSLEAIETSSQTLVDNLNADFLDGQEGAFYRNASNLNAGTLALLYGGTGSTTAAGARTNLGAAALAGSSTQDFSTQNLTVSGTTYNMLTLSRTTANGASILFQNSSGNLGKLGFDGSGNLIIGKGTTTDGAADLLKITPAGVTTFYNSVTASSFIKSGGTSSQFLKADGTVDSNAYLPSTGGAITGNTTIKGGTNVFEYTLRLAKGNYADTGGHTTLIGFGAETVGWSKSAIGHTRTDSYDRGYLGFYVNGASDTTSATASDLKMSINSAGDVAVVGSLSVGAITSTGNVTASTFIGNLNGNASSATSVTGTVPTSKGGTGLTAIGTAGQVLQVNSGGTGLEWGTVSGGGESRDKGVNNVTTLASLPISKRLVYATVTSATNISLSSSMEIGDELHIVVYNSSASAVTQVLPNTGAFVSMSNSYIPIPASGYVEINIICRATGSYIIRAGGVSW